MRDQASIEVTIVGAGPGGLFAAHKLVNKLGGRVKILIVDRGCPSTIRSCKALINGCKNCKICDLVSGGGGAGLFSDGKLIFDLYSGGDLREIISPEKKREIESQIRDVIDTFSSKYVYKKSAFPDDVRSCLQKQNIHLKTYPVLHIGSYDLRNFIQQFITYLQKVNVKFLFNTEVKEIKYDFSSNQWTIKAISRKNTRIIRTNYLVLSVGKEGNFWLTNQLEKFGGKVEDNYTYMGVRMEISDLSAKNFYDFSLDPKFSFCSDYVKIKTHCFCRHGQVILLKYSHLSPDYSNLLLAGGHTPYIEIDEQYNPEKFLNSNFAILYRDKSVCTKEKALEVMKECNKITNGKLLIQRLGDFVENIPTTEQKLKSNKIKPSNPNVVVPEEIPNNLLPGFRGIFIPFLEKLESCFPGVMDQDNLLYFPAIEWWMRKIKVNNNMEVIGFPNLYVIGDGSGWTQGIIQSAATGIISASDILQKIDKKETRERKT